ncbi:MAG: DUF998 domain-containing protein [Gudongella sp.]|nr:DUF998 domain-containing protein [Gudongella sp.]
MKKYGYIKWAFIFLFSVMFLLPFFTAEGYSIIKHTTSELGAQNTPNSWIMNLAFFAMGFACIIEAIIYLKGYLIQKIILIIFGVALIAAGVFSHMPIDRSIDFSLNEDYYHSIASSLTGFSFTIFTIAAAFIEFPKRRSIIAILVGLIVVGLSLLMIFIPEYSGVWQRLIFTISFVWMIYFFRRFEKNKRNYFYANYNNK